MDLHQRFVRGDASDYALRSFALAGSSIPESGSALRIEDPRLQIYNAITLRDWLITLN